MRERYITPGEKADRRTKNRLKMNGPLFHVGREIPIVLDGGSVKFLGDGVPVPARLLHSCTTDWVGWVPADHIRIDNPRDLGWTEGDVRYYILQDRKER